MNTKNLLDEEIKRLYDKLSKLDPDSEGYAELEDNWAKLVDRKIEIEKLESSEAQNEKQMKEDRKDRIVRYIIDSGKVILPLGVTVVGTLLAFTFEERGTISSNIGKKFMDKLTKY
jgi:hypothetical protein